MCHNEGERTIEYKVEISEEEIKMNTPLKIAFLIMCATLILWLIVSNIGRVWKVMCNSIFGMLALLIANLITMPFGFFIGINAATCLVCGFLGLPGFIMLFLLKLMV